MSGVTTETPNSTMAEAQDHQPAASDSHSTAAHAAIPAQTEVSNANSVPVPVPNAGGSAGAPAPTPAESKDAPKKSAGAGSVWGKAKNTDTAKSAGEGESLRPWIFEQPLLSRAVVSIQSNGSRYLSGRLESPL